MSLYQTKLNFNFQFHVVHHDQIQFCVQVHLFFSFLLFDSMTAIRNFDTHVLLLLQYMLLCHGPHSSFSITTVRVQSNVFSLFTPGGYPSPSHNTSTGPMSFLGGCSSPRGYPIRGVPQPGQDGVPPGQDWGTPQCITLGQVMPWVVCLLRFPRRTFLLAILCQSLAESCQD